MIGPSRPPTLGPQRPRAAPESDEDEYAPSLPPGYSKPVAGPSRPPPQPVPTSRPAYNDDESDDEVGPRPPPAAGSSRAVIEDAEAEFRARELREKERREEDAKPKKLHREDWMLRPPTESETMRNLDPTKLKARSFAPSSTKKSTSRDSTLWTETPDERAQRQADEVLGKRKKVENADGPADAEEEERRSRKRARDVQMRSQVESYNKSNRSTTLLDQHAGEQASKSNVDNEPKAIWDRDRDLGVSGKMMGDGKRKEMINEAKQLSSKFSGGSYL